MVNKRRRNLRCPQFQKLKLKVLAGFAWKAGGRIPLPLPALGPQVCLLGTVECQAAFILACGGHSVALQETSTASSIISPTFRTAFVSLWSQPQLLSRLPGKSRQSNGQGQDPPHQGFPRPMPRLHTAKTHPALLQRGQKQEHTPVGHSNHSLKQKTTERKALGVQGLDRNRPSFPVQPNCGVKSNGTWRRPQHSLSP